MLENKLTENMSFDRRCSKCKRVQIPECYKTGNRVFLTCNGCRYKAYRRTHPTHNLFDFHRGYRVVVINSDTETDNEHESIQVSNVALLSLSSAAASSDDYFVDEPEPEPEP